MFLYGFHSNKDKILPYPNPTTGLFKFNTNQITQTEVYDLNGRLLKTINNSATCNISELSSDVYLIKAHLKDKIILTFHIVKL